MADTEILPREGEEEPKDALPVEVKPEPTLVGGEGLELDGISTQTTVLTPPAEEIPPVPPTLPPPPPLPFVAVSSSKVEEPKVEEPADSGDESSGIRHDHQVHITIEDSSPEVKKFSLEEVAEMKAAFVKEFTAALKDKKNARHEDAKELAADASRIGFRAVKNVHFSEARNHKPGDEIPGLAGEDLTTLLAQDAVEAFLKD